MILVIKSLHGVPHFIISTDLGWFVGHTRAIIVLHRLSFKSWKTISILLGHFFIFFIEIYILLNVIPSLSILLWISLGFRHLGSKFLLCLIVISVLARLFRYILHLTSSLKLLLSLLPSSFDQILGSFDSLRRSLVLARALRHITVEHPFTLNWIIILVLRWFLRYLHRNIWI